MRLRRALAAVERRIEDSSALDRPGEALNAAISKVIRPGPLQDVLSGTAIGHPVHPAIVALPIGAWSSALVLDVLGHDDAATTLVGLGCLAAVPASATGASDWLSTAGAERRVGLVHAVTNYGATGLFGLSWLARRRGRRAEGVALSVGGAALLSVAGWLGGHLAFAQGVGVDTTAFQRFPDEWTFAAAVGDLPAPDELTQVEVDGVPLLIVGRPDGYVVMADRCTHRGAPLHDGEISDGCVVCPWHDSWFSADDGEVRRGPATRPQPLLESRVHDGRLEVRRHEPRTLRNNPVGR